VPRVLALERRAAHRQELREDKKQQGITHGGGALRDAAERRGERA